MVCLRGQEDKEDSCRVTGIGVGGKKALALTVLGKWGSPGLVVGHGCATRVGVVWRPQEFCVFINFWEKELKLAGGLV